MDQTGVRFYCGLRLRVTFKSCPCRVCEFVRITVSQETDQESASMYMPDGRKLVEFMQLEMKMDPQLTVDLGVVLKNIGTSISAGIRVLTYAAAGSIVLFSVGHFIR
jgi:hypothetical protein